MEGYPTISMDRLEAVYDELDKLAGADGGKDAMRLLLNMSDPAERRRLAVFVSTHALRLIEAAPVNRADAGDEEFMKINVEAGVLGSLLIGYVAGVQAQREESDGI